MFKYFYLFLTFIIYILAIPYLLYKSRSKKYSEAIPAKFFLKNNPKFNKELIWFHACSMGETIALKSIIEQFDEVNLSVITNTGYEKASELSSNVRYLPYELFLPFWIVKQKALVVMEAELWYMLFLGAKSKNIPTYLINARISDRSYQSYKKFHWFYKKIFENIDMIFAQSQEDKKRLESLGGKNIKVIGNIKLTNLPVITKKLIKPEGITITAASTHDTEEELILESWERSMGRLVIVPRHPERFEEVYSLIEQYSYKYNLSYSRYSQSDNFNSDITLVDMMGELNNIYAISDVVILGGGFIKTAGGHNPIEPAFFNCKLISGEIIFNQKALFECVNNHYLIKNNQLKQYLSEIEKLKNTSLGEKGDIQPILEELKKI